MPMNRRIQSSFPTHAPGWAMRGGALALVHSANLSGPIGTGVTPRCGRDRSIRFDKTEP